MHHKQCHSLCCVCNNNVDMTESQETCRDNMEQMIKSIQEKITYV